MSSLAYGSLILQDNPIPRPGPIESIKCDASKPYNSEDSCLPLDHTSELPWSLAEVFGRGIKGSCSLEGAGDLTQESVCLTVPEDRQVEVHTSAHDTELQRKLPYERCYQLSGELFLTLLYIYRALTASRGP